MASFVGAIAIADLVKTTLGPKGMDKILQSVRAGMCVCECVFFRTIHLCKSTRVEMVWRMRSIMPKGAGLSISIHQQ